jgi:recombination protein RecA
MPKQAVKRTPANTPSKKDAEWEFINRVVGDMENKFGKGSALTPDAGTVLCRVDHWVSTRNFMIDSCIAGGLPMPRPIIPFGRVTEIAGLNGTGKTTLLLQIMAETQAAGGVAAIIDTEQALDLQYAERLGVNLSKLIVVQADTIEDVFVKKEALITTIKQYDSDRLICLGWDSLGQTPTNAQAEADPGDHFYAEAAKVVGKNLQRTTQMISKQRIALIVNNHVYRKMDVKFGDPWESYGGQKIQFVATLRIRLKRVGQISEEHEGTKQVVGHKVEMKIIKNKMAPLLRSVNVPCIGNHGFSLDYSIFEQGAKQGVLAGNTWKSWTTPKGEAVKFQGWRGFQEKVVTHPEYPELVREVVKNYHQRATVKS